MVDDKVKPPSAKHARSAGFVLLIGLLLSAVMIIPSIRITPKGTFDAVFHPVLFASLSAPFIVIYFLFRRSQRTAIISGVLFCLGHLYLIYVSYAFRPQEFGYIGLIFAPFLEAVIAVPLTVILVLVAKRSARG